MQLLPSACVLLLVLTSQHAADGAADQHRRQQLRQLRSQGAARQLLATCEPGTFSALRPVRVLCGGMHAGAVVASPHRCHQREARDTSCVSSSGVREGRLPDCVTRVNARLHAASSGANRSLPAWLCVGVTCRR
jgi:hypothetical protein